MPGIIEHAFIDVLEDCVHLPLIFLSVCIQEIFGQMDNVLGPGII